MSAKSYSTRTMEAAPKVSVSITSAPASRNPRWTVATASGLVWTRYSLQPSYSLPPKSSAVRFWTCRLVPIAPSKTMTGREGWWSRSRNRLFISSKKRRCYIFTILSIVQYYQQSCCWGKSIDDRTQCC